MNFKNNNFTLFFTVCSLMLTPLFAAPCGDECGPKVCGKLDVSAAYVHIDLLNQGRTVEKMDIPAARADLCYAVWKGLLIKPTVTYGYNNQELLMTGCGIGHIIPINKSFSLTPVAGFNYSFMDTVTDRPLPGVFIPDVKRAFRSYGGYIGLEGSYTICKGNRVYLTYQYAWTRNIASLRLPLPFGTVYSREHSQGSAVSGMFEQDFNDRWSWNIAGAYNNSASKERNGMRAYGGKFGIVRWF